MRHRLLLHNGLVLEPEDVEMLARVHDAFPGARVETVRDLKPEQPQSQPRPSAAED
jgi:hypothetical protein